MNVLPTPDGGLRILIKTKKNWELLRSILTDAAGCQTDLASRLGGLISEEAGAEDWHEYVVPDLREEFEDELKHVRDARRVVARSTLCLPAVADLLGNPVDAAFPRDAVIHSGFGTGSGFCFDSGSLVISERPGGVP